MAFVNLYVIEIAVDLVFEHVFYSIMCSRLLDNLLLTIFACQEIATVQLKRVLHAPLCQTTMSVYWTGTARLFLIVLHLSAVTMAVVTIVLQITVSYQHM